ncbi:MAG: cytochrome b5-like heme/steroid binding domain-containing protein [Patescibacteria group bacterium]
MFQKFIPTIIFIIVALIFSVVITIIFSVGPNIVIVPSNSTNSVILNTTNPNPTPTTITTPKLTPTSAPKPKPKPAPTPVSATDSYTLSQIAQHGDSKSCWTTVNGGVYDITAWIDQHPGGAQAILGMCGIDASSAYNDQHDGQRRPTDELASFKIGTLR